MQAPGHLSRDGRWTRARLLRTAAGGGAALAGGAVIGRLGGQATSIAAPSEETDTEILNLFLLLEYVQEGLYEEALRVGRLTGDLQEFASTVSAQETEHVGLLDTQLGTRARAKPTLDFGDALESAERFRDRAIELEEAAVAAYIGQSANLTDEALASVAPIVSVEARQVAWVRDLAGVSPAPRAADPGRKADEILEDLRSRGYIR